MGTQFSANATTAGALFSTNLFEVPQFQREYAWTSEEYEEFWDDVKRSLADDSYFLGLVILTGEGQRKQVVDGQQRLLTVTLLATALHQNAVAVGRAALADRIRSDFLETINYETDDVDPRIVLADSVDNETLRRIVAGDDLDLSTLPPGDDRLSRALVAAFMFLSDALRRDLASDPFRRLGTWTEFLSSRLQFAVFLHPNAASAYRVFEVINTRGRELTTADLLKNHLLSQTSSADKGRQYARWQSVSRPLADAGPGALVQFIRHVVTVRVGHVLPKDLFDYLAHRKQGVRPAPPINELLDLLEADLPLYLQMIDPSLEGPGSPAALRVFEALSDLNVIAVRPLLLAMSALEDADAGMERILELVVRRITVGNLGTGNVERRFGDAARTVYEERSWQPALASLRDLNPPQDEFVRQLGRRSYNKGILQFLRRSIIQLSKTPEPTGYLHLIRPRQASDWAGFDADEVAFWGSTIGNSLLIEAERRPSGALDWPGAKENLLKEAIDGEWTDRLLQFENWGPDEVEAVGQNLAEVAAGVWY